MAATAQKKALGAYYTADAVAEFLVHWAVRHPNDAVMDPSCGDGVFLAAATQRLGRLGCKRPEVWGIDVDPSARRNAPSLSESVKFLTRDFFRLRPGEIPYFNAVVGNPPFIRYQTFNGSMRSAPLERAAEAGVKLPQLSSSWAPFLVHAVSFLRHGGRLGMVAPAELAHAQYAREVLRFLLQKFGRITVRMFQQKLFPELSEDTILLLCEDHGTRCGWFSVAPTQSIDAARLTEDCEIPVDIEAIRSGRSRLTHYLLPSKARHLYETMSEQSGVLRLGDAADVGIGYVTGCNDYFHLSREEVKKWRIPARFLKPALLSFGDYKGALFRATDWHMLRDCGKKSFLFALPTTGLKSFPGSISGYLEHGKQLDVPSRFKCRVRQPWYSVPHVRVADAFLSYMSGQTPKLVVNRAGLVAPNTLHIVRFAKPWDPKTFVAGWYSSLTRLSCELEGHPLGGGMLKLEPTEAERVLVALPQPRDVSELIRQLDESLRQTEVFKAVDLADSRILRARYGLSAAECTILRSAAAQLEEWRMH